MYIYITISEYLFTPTVFSATGNAVDIHTAVLRLLEPLWTDTHRKLSFLLPLPTMIPVAIDQWLESLGHESQWPALLGQLWDVIYIPEGGPAGKRLKPTLCRTLACNCTRVCCVPLFWLALPLPLLVSPGIISLINDLLICAILKINFRRTCSGQTLKVYSTLTDWFFSQ